MASSLILLLALFWLPLILQDLMALAHTITSRTETQKDDDFLVFEIQEAKLKLAQLESVLEKTTKDSDAKSEHIRQSEKKIQEMNQEIDRLQTTLASFQDDTSSTNRDPQALEEQVQLLWEASRQNNFEIYNLEFKARDAEERVNLVTSQVEEMADIVSEQWTQIQQLEQALEMAQRRASNVKRQPGATKCPFVKSIKMLFGQPLEMSKGILYPYASAGQHVLKSCISEALDLLKRIYTAAKYYHHQLQGYIKQTMLRNKFTAILADDEVVFVVASSLIIFPVLGLYTMLSCRLS